MREAVVEFQFGQNIFGRQAVPFFGRQAVPFFWSPGCAIFLVGHNWLEENKQRHAVQEWCWGELTEGRKEGNNGL